ncbi:YadA-like family protein [Paraburkholderia sp. PREW-6R]|uniref:YadA-like family protein n=1 Tax=Paraburkholderia sp. PREW-6R TaxID=3141544 RepID=UPI0031F4B965
MNKSYISIWNDASGTWVAAPETAKARSGTGTVASSGAIVTSVDSRPSTPLKAMFMPIAMAIGAAMMPGMAAAQTSPGNGGLELCPGGVGGVGSSWGPLSSAVGIMSCNGTSGSAGMSFSLNNAAADNGAWGYNDGGITARVTGYDDGHLEIVGDTGIKMIGTVDMTGNKIIDVAPGTISSTSADAVNGAQLYQYSRYFQANSPSSEPASSALAKGASSVASGPYAIATGSNSSAYGANSAALASNSVALGSGSVAARPDSVSVGYLSADGTSQYTRQITNVTAGAAGTDAVNVDQLNAAIASVSGGGSGSVVANAVTYDSSASTLITLKGTKGTKITNLTAGDISSAYSTDAVNGSQLFQTNQNVTNVVNNVANLSGDVSNVTNVVNNIVNNGIAGNPLVVTYDSSARDEVTLGGVNSPKAVRLTNVAAGDISSAASTDAVNGGQLYTTNQNLQTLANNVGDIVVNLYDRGVKYFHTNSTLADSSAVGADSVAIGGAAIANGQNSVALGSNSLADRDNAVSVGAVGAERQIINVANATNGTDAVNLQQLQAMGANVTSGVVTNSFVAYDDTTKGKVTFGGVGASKAVTLSNVAAGVSATDAVNLGQMNAAIANASGGGGGSPDAVVYDTPAHDQLTLGGVSASAPVGLTNVAAGQVTSDSKDAINGSQLFNTASSVANALGGGSSVDPSGAVTKPTYAVQGNTYNDVGSALSGLDSAITSVDNSLSNTSKYVRIVSTSSSAIATGDGSVAIGGSSYSSGSNAVAVGAGSRAMFADSVALGANSRVSAANTVSVGDTGAERRITNVANGTATTDAVTVAQLNALQSSLTQEMQSQSSGTKAVLKSSAPVGATLLGAAPVTSYIAVSSNVTQGTTTSTDSGLDAMAIGPTAMALGDRSLAVGAGSGTALAGSTAVGSSAAALALDTTVIGAGASTNSFANNAVAIGYNSAAQGVNALSLGSLAVTNATNSVAIGANAMVTNAASNSMALGANSVANQANSMALGANSTTDRANSVSVGSSSAQRQVTFVAAGTQATDAVNVTQLAGVASLIGGGAGVNSDGSIKKPSITIGGTTYNDVTSAITAAATSSTASAVQYDSSARNKVTLGGVGASAPVALSNVANGVSGSDAVNVAQLQAMGGTINSSGVVTNSFVAYDDTTKGAITLKGTGGTTITNVKAGALTTASLDAVNGSQLYQTNEDVANVAGNVANIAGNVTNVTNTVNNIVNGGGIKYFHTNSTLADSSATGTDSVAIGGAATASAVNSVALGSNSVANRANAVSVGTAGAERQIINVANGTNGTDAINLSQLTAMGANVNSSGVVTNSFVAYDDTTKGKVTLGGSGATKAVTITNVANGVSGSDAVNVAQLQAMGGTINSSGVVTNAFVAYDDTTKNSITLRGASGSTKITGLTAGTLSATSLDAVNGSQLYQTNANVANVAGTVTNVTNTVNNIVDGGGIKYFHTNSTLADSSATGTDSVAIGGAASASANNSVALGSNSVANRVNAVSVGAAGAERQIINVANGTNGTDAINLSQLTAMGANINSSGVVTNAFVAYDDTTKGKVTLGGSGATKAVTITNVANGVSGSDAVNVAQLQAMGGTINSSGVVTNAFVAYDDTTKNSITLRGASGSTKITGLTAGALSATSLDAVNGSQLYQTNANVANVAGTVTNVTNTVNNIVDGGGIKYFHTNSTLADSSATGTDSVAIGGAASASANNSVALGSNSVANRVNAVSVGAVGAERQIINVANGTNGTDAINLSQLTAMGANINTSGVVTNAFVAYDDTTKNTITLKGASGSTKISGLAAGAVSSTSADAINGAQLYRTAASVANALGGGSAVNVNGSLSAPSYELSVGTYADVGSALSGLDGEVSSINNNIADTTKYIKVVSQSSAAVATGSEAVAIGGGSFASGENSLALGAGARSMFADSVALGANSRVSAANTVSVGDTGAERRITNVANGISSTDAVTLGQLDALQTSLTQQITSQTSGVKAGLLGAAPVSASLLGATPIASVTAVSSNLTPGLAATSSDDALNNMAIGPGSSVQGADSVVFGARSGAFFAGSTVVGSGAVSIATNATVIGNSASTNNLAVNSVAIGYLAAAQAANSLAFGSDAISNGDSSVAMGSNAFVSVGAANSMAIGGNATASVANAVAIGYGAIADRANTVSVGSASRLMQITNVAQGSQDTDAVNVAQLNAAIQSVSSGGAPDAVVYDGSAHTSLTLNKGGSAVALSNVANGVASSDAVNVAQLQAMGGTIDSNGVVTNSFVAYDDTTKGAITLKGANGTTITNVKAGALTAASLDAVNGSQLYQTNANVANIAGTMTNVTNTVNNIVDGGGIKYFHANSSLADSSAMGADSVAMGGAANASAANSVALGSNSVADRANAVSVGAAGAERQIINVANGTHATDAVNLSQLEAMGANVDSGGVVTNSFVAYDDLSKGTVTFGGLGSSTPVQLKNVAAGTDATDAVNFGQMESYVAQNGGGGGGTANGVAYDDSTKSKVTLGGAGSTTPVVLTNVAAGSSATDAVNYSQFSSLQSQVNDIANGGAGDTTYVNINTPASGGTAAAATGSDSIAIGNGAAATGSTSIAIGKNTVTAGDNSVAMGAGATAPNANAVALGANSTTDRDNSVSVGSAGAERQITNVAAGTQGTDAVNLNQLNSAMGNMSNSINNVDKSAAKGIASASALNIVTPYLPGRTTLNAGVANYRGYQAVGLGVSRWNDKGTINYNLGVSTSGGNSTIVRAGIGIVLGD